MNLPPLPKSTSPAPSPKSPLDTYNVDGIPPGSSRKDHPKHYYPRYRMDLVYLPFPHLHSPRCPLQTCSLLSPNQNPDWSHHLINFALVVGSNKDCQIVIQDSKWSSTLTFLNIIDQTQWTSELHVLVMVTSGRHMQNVLVTKATLTPWSQILS